MKTLAKTALDNSALFTRITVEQSRSFGVMQMPRTVLNGRTVSASRTVATPPPAPPKAKHTAVPAATPAAAPQILPDLSAMVAAAVAQALATTPAAAPAAVNGAAQLAPGISIKLNKSGGFYVHDGRFGFNLYVGNWKVISTHFKAIDAWVNANRASLRSK